MSVAASGRLGKVIDLAWVPLPAPIGGGSVVVVAGEDGSLACVDATQTVEQRSPKRRLAAFKNLVGGRWPFPQVPPASLHTLCHQTHFASSCALCPPTQGRQNATFPRTRLCSPGPVESDTFWMPTSCHLFPLTHENVVSWRSCRPALNFCLHDVCIDTKQTKFSPQ